jgi:hypothetical protein
MLLPSEKEKKVTTEIAITKGRKMARKCRKARKPSVKKSTLKKKGQKPISLGNKKRALKEDYVPKAKKVK